MQPRTQRISHILIVLIVMLMAGGAALGLLVQNAQASSATSTIPQADSHTIQGQAMTNETTPRPVQNALIVAQKGDETITATTGVDGRYAMQVPLAASVWTAHAERSSETLPAEALAPNTGFPAIFTSNRTPQTRSVDFTFQVANAHLVGRVLVTGTEQVPDVPVTITALQLLPARSQPDTADESTAVIIRQTIDPASGNFDLTMPPGTYQVTAIPDDLTKYLPPVIAPVTVSADQPTDLGALYLTPLQVGNLATISGRVRKPDGAGVAGVQVIGVNTETRTPTIPTDSLENGEFTLRVEAGTWWVGVALDADEPYMPYKTEWQTVVTVEAQQAITDVELVIVPTDAAIHGTLTQGDGGPQATDACGVVAAYKKGEPGIYNFRTFNGGVFDLPVITGTYRLAVVPEPGVEGLQAFLPEGCTSGQYLITTQPNVVVDAPETVSVTIPLQTNSAAIHGQLWDRALDQAVTGWSGQVLGWSPALQTWTAATIDATSGRADLRAAPGQWLLAFHVDPNSGYVERPAVAHINVETGTTDVDVHLNVVKAAASVHGQVLDPAGNPVPRALVSAIGVPGGDSKVTDSAGGFTLTLDYGAYMVEVFGPAEPKTEKAWISPEPAKLTVTEGEAPPSLVLQYRNGDAVIHGQVTLAQSQSAASAASTPQQAVVWAVTTGGRTKTRVTIPMAQGEEYSLPALMGSDWWVVASYWDGSQVWFAQQKVMVDRADIPLNLTLVPTSQSAAAQHINQAIDTAQSFYAELSDGVQLYIPAGVLNNLAQAQSTDSVDMGQFRKTLHLYQDAGGLLNTDLPGDGTCCEMQDNPFASGLHLISPAYTLGMVDRAGNPLTDNNIRGPMILKIPYRSIGAGLVVALKQVQIGAGSNVARQTSTGATAWAPVDNYVVDEANQQVVIFASEWGTYAVGVSVTHEEVYLPLTSR